MSISIKEFSKAWWTEVYNRIIGATVFLDDYSAECLHWEGGLYNLISNGAVTVKGLSPFEVISCTILYTKHFSLRLVCIMNVCLIYFKFCKTTDRDRIREGSIYNTSNIHSTSYNLRNNSQEWYYPLYPHIMCQLGNCLLRNEWGKRCQWCYVSGEGSSRGNKSLRKHAQRGTHKKGGPRNRVSI